MEDQTQKQQQAENNSENPNQFAAASINKSDFSADDIATDSQEDGDLPPPEDENEATQINVSAIFGAFFILVFLIICIFLIFGHKKQKVKNTDMEKASSKYGYNFDLKEMDKEEKKPVNTFENSISQENPAESNTMTDEQIQKELEAFEGDDTPAYTYNTNSGKAPVRAVGSNYSNVERPDTRNSKSPRKIDGLKGQSSPDANKSIVSAALNGSGTTSQNERMTKEDYILQMMNRTQQIQNQVYGSNTSSGSFGSNSSYDYQGNKESFFTNNTGNGAGSGTYLSYNSLWDGTIISGALVTGINTDNPGVVIARVTENIYSSYDHSFLLIPEGSLLYATYNSSVSYGQDSVQVAWNLLIRPDGYRISLGNMNGVDSQGMSGYEGKVNNHNWQMMKAFGLIAVYSMIQTEISNDISNTNNEYLQNAMTDVYTEAKKLGNKIVDRALDIKPTITIKAGTEIKLITNIPLELPPVEIPKASQKYVRTK